MILKPATDICKRNPKFFTRFQFMQNHFTYNAKDPLDEKGVFLCSWRGARSPDLTIMSRAPAILPYLKLSKTSVNKLIVLMTQSSGNIKDYLELWANGGQNNVECLPNHVES